MSSVYCPPYKITATILNLVAQISEAIGSIKAGSNIAAVPNLRRGNQIILCTAENSTLDCGDFENWFVF
jgi:hypothetical protein